MLTRRATLVTTLAAAGTGAHAQTEGPYPNRPVRIIVTTAPGGPTDVMARIVSPGLSAKFCQPAVIV